ncbi:unnamed protein product [Vicia faba]|uniref:Ubiquitin-like protease family profile domain-containing protein n=1 Tax=Vicia faba TaxID=3906 RepID=A0AAV0ZJT5_VICFA|nr:unnamed protein product [Vicia faba]
MLTFSHRCIKINVSTASMKQGAFDIEWGLDDLIDIKCQLFPSSGTVIIKINVISRNADQLDHEPFDEVIYPEGDPDAVSLSKRDFDLLQPDTFINDTIIDFYIHASDGKAAFLRVRKWTRKVNLFEKDYIFIPVNFNLHWSLIVICHPGEVVNFNDEELANSLRVPSLPQQDNSYDCGLFLLHYLELFLAEAPLTFNPFKLTKFSNFLNVDWFLLAEAYLKRTLIQKLISELVENRDSREISSSDYSDDPQYIENKENRICIEHPEVNRESKISFDGQGIEMTLLSGSSSLDPQSFNDPGMVLKDLYEPGASAATSAQCHSFDQQPSDYRFNNSIFSTEETSDLGEQLMYLATDTNLATYTNFQQVAEVTPQACPLP